MTSVFFSYSHADETLRDQLEKQLAVMRRQGIITAWHDRSIGAGEEFESVIDRHLESDDIILLLVSPDFLASDYCYEREMERALERHRAGSAIVIPVILRACDWKHSPFGKLLATPPDGRPVTLWADRDDAFFHVAQAIRDAVRRVNERQLSRDKPPPAPPPQRTAKAAKAEARSGTQGVAAKEGSGTRQAADPGAAAALPKQKDPARAAAERPPPPKAAQMEKPASKQAAPQADPKPAVAVWSSIRYEGARRVVIFSAQLRKNYFTVVISTPEIDRFCNKDEGHMSPPGYMNFIAQRMDALAAYAGRKWAENPNVKEIILRDADLWDSQRVRRTR